MTSDKFVTSVNGTTTQVQKKYGQSSTTTIVENPIRTSATVRTSHAAPVQVQRSSFVQPVSHVAHRVSPVVRTSTSPVRTVAHQTYSAAPVHTTQTYAAAPVHTTQTYAAAPVHTTQTYAAAPVHTTQTYAAAPVQTQYVENVRDVEHVVAVKESNIHNLEYQNEQIIVEKPKIEIEQVIVEKPVITTEVSYTEKPYVQQNLRENEVVSTHQILHEKPVTVTEDVEIPVEQNHAQIVDQPVHFKQQVLREREVAHKQTLIHERPVVNTEQLVVERPVYSANIVTHDVPFKQQVYREQVVPQVQKILHEKPVYNTEEIPVEKPVIEIEIIEKPVVVKQQILKEVEVVQKQQVFVDKVIIEKEEINVDKPIYVQEVVENPVTHTQQCVVEVPHEQVKQIVVEQPRINIEEVVVEKPIVEEEMVANQVVQKQQVVRENPVVSKEHVQIDVVQNHAEVVEQERHCVHQELVEVESHRQVQVHNETPVVKQEQVVVDRIINQANVRDVEREFVQQELQAPEIIKADIDAAQVFETVQTQQVVPQVTQHAAYVRTDAKPLVTGHRASRIVQNVAQQHVSYAAAPTHTIAPVRVSATPVTRMNHVSYAAAPTHVQTTSSHYGVPSLQVIQAQVEDMWPRYDVDRSGALDKQETKRFVEDLISSHGLHKVINEHQVYEIFRDFDTSGDGLIQKNEMARMVLAYYERHPPKITTTQTHAVNKVANAVSHISHVSPRATTQIVRNAGVSYTAAPSHVQTTSSHYGVPSLQVIQAQVEDMWPRYDVDRSGALDKQETKRFVEDLISSHGLHKVINEQQVYEIFRDFDTSGDGLIQKNEMARMVLAYYERHPPKITTTQTHAVNRVVNAAMSPRTVVVNQTRPTIHDL